MAKRKKGTRNGEKLTRSHTTVIPAAEPIVDALRTCGAVKKVSLGFISAGLSSARGLHRVKISVGETSITLTVRGGTSSQLVHVFGNDLPRLREVVEECVSTVPHIRIERK